MQRNARSYHLLGRAFDAINVPMVLVDVGRTDQPVIGCNPAFCRFTGFAENTVIGRNCRFLQGDDRDQAGRRDLATAIGDRREARVVLRNYRADGTMFLNEISLVPLAGDNGEIRHYVGVLRDISEQVAFEEQLRELASTDPLTGLHNRRRFESLVEREMRRAHRYSHPLVLLMFDLDHFKAINDDHGHASGDAVLRTFAACLRDGLREQDIMARVGGEEFAALLPETDAAAGTEVAERLRAAVAAATTPCGTAELRVTMSIGLTRLADHDDGYASLLARADAALYASKQQGRDRVTVA